VRAAIEGEKTTPRLTPTLDAIAHHVLVLKIPHVARALVVLRLCIEERLALPHRLLALLGEAIFEHLAAELFPLPEREAAGEGTVDDAPRLAGFRRRLEGTRKRARVHGSRLGRDRHH